MLWRMSGGLQRVVVGTCVIAPAVGCGGGDETAPVLVEAAFEDPSTLVLTFSEPIASVVDVDPVTHFRLGSAFALEALDLTVYYDLSHHFGGGFPGSGGDASGPWQRHGFTVVSRVEHGDDPSQLRLSISYPIIYYVCDNLALASEMGIPAGIHLHYAQAGFPRVTDEAGNPLADIGAWWVAASFSTTQPGEFPELDMRMPIPCPEL
ncbi:hypothetical protein DB30_04745 [Enhygromyxa salina]|uniref:Uncharacterized protein n=2 Tax=Enhygromyxa salina TaxID=215803 RepID=A0A0C2D3H5_9BACT|nr:hypothetical protein DB30_04745 [Enhygromyxa salina]